MNLKETIVIDIETVTHESSYNKLTHHWQQLWSDKVSKVLPEGVSVAEFYPRRAGVMAEFSKIICICIGYYSNEHSNSFEVVSFFDCNEQLLLNRFCSYLNEIVSKQKKKIIGGHNVKEFDIPFICRRLLINQIPIPQILNMHLQKPWEQKVVDTFQLWRFGDYKNYTSLHLLASILDVPTSKIDIDGSMIGPLYWEADPIQQELNMLRIIDYCCRDIVTTTNILLRFENKPLLSDMSVTILNR